MEKLPSVLRTTAWNYGSLGNKFKLLRSSNLPRGTRQLPSLPGNMECVLLIPCPDVPTTTPSCRCCMATEDKVPPL